MKMVRRFCFDFKESLKMNAHISSYSPGKVTGEFFKIAITPFIVVTFIGVATLFTSAEWGQVLFRASQEFMQVIGLKLAAYLLLLFLALSTIFYPYSSLAKLLALFTKLISNIGFAITAGLAGTIGGMTIAEILNGKSTSSLSSIISFYFIILLLFIMFYCVPNIFSDKVRKEIDDIELKYKKIITFTFGFLILFIVIYGFINETWN